MSRMSLETAETSPDQNLDTAGKIKKLVEQVVRWLPLILSIALPPWTGYTIATAAALGVAFVLFILSYRQKQNGVIKVWPKTLDCGMLVLWTGILVAQLAADPGDDFNDTWHGVIVCGGLAALTLTTILMKKPFTMQYAMDTLPEERWTQPSFYRGCFHTACIWLVAFTLMALSILLADIANPDDNDTITTIFAKVAPMVILVLAFRVQYEYVKFARKREKEEAGTKNNTMLISVEGGRIDDQYRQLDDNGAVN